MSLFLKEEQNDSICRWWLDFFHFKGKCIQVTTEIKEEDKQATYLRIIRSTENLKGEWKWGRILELFCGRM